MSQRSIVYRASLAATALVLVAPAGMAAAAQPKEGYYDSCADVICFEDLIYFTVKKKDGAKIQKFNYYDGNTCGSLEVPKNIPVRKSGKFSYEGNAKDEGGDNHRVTIKGKFVSKKKAKGTFNPHESCRGETVSFIARFGG